jgi:hypothetical protein
VLTKIETNVKTVKKDTLSSQNKKMFELLEYLVNEKLIRKPFVRLRLDNEQIKMLFLDTLDYKKLKQFDKNSLRKEHKKVRIKASVTELHFDSLSAYNTLKLISVDKIDGETYWTK